VEIAISFIAVASAKFSEVPPLEILQSLCRNISQVRTPEAAEAAFRNHAKLRATEVFVWTHPQQPVHRTHPTRLFDFGSLAMT
jgi:hypothetical protein